MNSAIEPATLLDRTADRIERDGWIGGSPRYTQPLDDRGPQCLLSAMMLEVANEPVRWWQWRRQLDMGTRWSRKRGSVAWSQIHSSPAAKRAIAALWGVASCPDTLVVKTYCFSDFSGGKDAVVDKLRSAARRLREASEPKSRTRGEGSVREDLHGNLSPVKPLPDREDDLVHA